MALMLVLEPFPHITGTKETPPSRGESFSESWGAALHSARQLPAEILPEDGRRT